MNDPRSTETGPGPSDSRSPAVLLEDGIALVEAGKIAEGEAALREAIELAKEQGDRSLEWRAVLELCESQMQSEPEGSYERAFDRAGRAVQWFTTTGDDRGLARSWEIIAGSLFFRGEVGLAEQAIRRALEHARIIGDRRQVHRLVVHRANAALEGPSTVPDAIDLCLGAVAELYDDRSSQSVVQLNLATLHAYLGAFEEADELFARGKATLEDVGTTYATVAIAHEGGRMETVRGDPVAAEVAYRRGYETLGKLGERSYRSTLAAYLARALIDQDRIEEAEGFAEESEATGAVDDITTQISWRSARALLLGRHGDTIRAARVASDAVQLAERTDFVPFQAGAWMDLARVLAAAESWRRAAHAAREALARYERKGITVLAEQARAFLAEAPDEVSANVPR
jgi:tetratricopeptide (TPR) repeat protein